MVVHLINQLNFIPTQLKCILKVIQQLPKYIFDACWKNWIEERYDVDSKVLTGYFDLSLVDYNLFQFNKFVSIGHNLYKC